MPRIPEAIINAADYMPEHYILLYGPDDVASKQATSLYVESRVYGMGEGKLGITPFGGITPIVGEDRYGVTPAGEPSTYVTVHGTEVSETGTVQFYAAARTKDGLESDISSIASVFVNTTPAALTSRSISITDNKVSMTVS